jgi:hypothetical protein
MKSYKTPKRVIGNTAKTKSYAVPPSPNFFWHFNIPGLMRSLSLMTTGGALLIGGLIAFGVWRSGDQFLSEVKTLFSTPQPPPRVDPRTTIVQQIRGASELTTAVFTMETVVPTSRDRTIAGYVVGKTTLLYIAYGEVRAGVDLAAIRPNDVQVNGDTLLLRLPPPRILDSKIDVNRSKVFDYDRGFLGLGPDAAPELQQLAQQETLNKIVESACSSGVLQAASDRAKVTVGQLLMTAGYGQFSVETQPPSADACVPSSASGPLQSTPQPTASEPPQATDSEPEVVPQSIDSEIPQAIDSEPLAPLPPPPSNNDF